MKTHANKAQEDKTQPIVKPISKKKNNNEAGFEDNRPDAAIQRKLQVLANTTTAHNQPVQIKQNKTGLPNNLKAGIENLSGYKMDDVKVYYNSDKPAQFQAHAYAQGTDIHLASGQEKHLPHEAWHVVQQKQGRVKPTIQMKGKVNINDDAGLEKEADVMGQKSIDFGTNMPSQVAKPLFAHNMTHGNDSATAQLIKLRFKKTNEDNQGVKKFEPQRLLSIVADLMPEIMEINESKTAGMQITVDYHAKRSGIMGKTNTITTEDKNLFFVKVAWPDDATPDEVIATLMHEIELHITPKWNIHKTLEKKGEEVVKMPNIVKDERQKLGEDIEHKNPETWTLLLKKAVAFKKENVILSIIKDARTHLNNDKLIIEIANKAGVDRKLYDYLLNPEEGIKKWINILTPYVQEEKTPDEKILEVFHQVLKNHTEQELRMIAKGSKMSLEQFNKIVGLQRKWEDEPI
jgi:hypothetical protein